MTKPSPKEVSEVAGISQSYASMILNESDLPSRSRTPPRPLAIHIYRRTEWKHPSIESLTDEQLALFEQVEPWTPKEAAA